MNRDEESFTMVQVRNRGLRIRELEVKNYLKSGKVGWHSIIRYNNEL